MKRPGYEGPASRISKLWEQAKEYERRTFSNLSVTNPANGVTQLEVTPLSADPSRSQIVLRDTSGNELLKNDTTAGWGLSSPRNSYPAYPRGPRLAGTETVFTERWMYNGFVYMPNIEWAYVHGTDFSDTFSEARVVYRYADEVSETVIPGSVTQSNEDVSDTSTVFTVRSGTFTLPPRPTGTVIFIVFQQRKAIGPGSTTYMSPNYLNAF